MFRSDLILSLLVLVAFLQTPASSQETSCLHRTLSLTLEDSKGLPIEGLRTADLQSKFRPGPMKFLSIVPDDRPHRIVILVDASGTMATKWQEVLAPASGLADRALPNTKMALLVFKDKIEEQVNFSQGQSAVSERLRQIRSMTNASGQVVGGRTALFDSLLAGLQLLETPTSADSLYLISDGADNASRAHFDDVVQRLSSSEVRLFVSLTVGHYENRSPNPGEERGPLDMTDLAKRQSPKRLNGFHKQCIAFTKRWLKTTASKWSCPPRWTSPPDGN